MMHNMPESKTMPPGPADDAALEHARKLSAIDAEIARRGRAGLIRDLAEGYFARQPATHDR